jgi:hypothetical protein
MTKRYSVLLAYDIPCYATVIVEADSHEEAERKALDAFDETDFEPCWENWDDLRVVDGSEEVDENDMRKEVQS